MLFEKGLDFFERREAVVHGERVGDVHEAPQHVTFVGHFDILGRLG